MGVVFPICFSRAVFWFHYIRFIDSPLYIWLVGCICFDVEPKWLKRLAVMMIMMMAMMLCVTFCFCCGPLRV